MKIHTLFIISLLVVHISQGQKLKGSYMGQQPPGILPEIFAADFISKADQYEFGSVFSRDGTEFFYGIDQGKKSVIAYSRNVDGVWSDPLIILECGEYGCNDPMLSPDEGKLFFISSMPSGRTGNTKDIDIWYVERNTDGGWSGPINAGDEINSAANDYYISFTSDGAMYFASNIHAGKEASRNFDIYRSVRLNGEFQTPAKLDDNINSNFYEADAFIAPDESYLIFCSVRKGGYGQGDLYISFNSNGTWSQAKNMGESINNEFHQLCPFVSRDGKYLFFTSDQDIYWVDAGIIDQYRE